jgi:hypothetical protein
VPSNHKSGSRLKSLEWLRETGAIFCSLSGIGENPSQTLDVENFPFFRVSLFGRAALIS